MGHERKNKADPRPDPEEARAAVRWIVGRLNVLEYLILFFALVLALAGGALVAWVVHSAIGLSFRWTWALASLLLFILPGGFVYLREFRGKGSIPEADPTSEPKEPNV